jgi:hypothetical protein
MHRFGIGSRDGNIPLLVAGANQACSRVSDAKIDRLLYDAWFIL